MSARVLSLRNRLSLRNWAHSIAVALVAAALSLSPLPLRAAEPEGDPTAEPAPEGEDAEALSAKAVEAFRAKDYDGAIDLFNRAYAIDPQPNFLFNIGRVYEEKGDLQNAVKYYQDFVKQPGVDLDARETALTHLKALRATIAELEGEKPKTDPEPTADTARVEPVDAPVPSRRRKLRIAGYSLLGVGGVALTIGAVFGGLAIAKSRDAEDAPLVDDTLSLRQEAKARANVADGLIITGAVLAGAGLIIVLTTIGKAERGRSRKSAARPTFAPSLGAGRVGLSMTGRF